MALPASDEIHLLLVEEDAIDADLLARYSLLLSSDERARHARIRAPGDKRSFLIARAAVRTALSHCVPEVGAAEWQFSRNAHGRPAIAGPLHGVNLTFNLSHATGLVVVALAIGGELGVDVECVDRDLDVIGIAQRYFASEEVNALLELPASEQRARFFDLWTLKEAWVKANGTGLAVSLQRISFAVAADVIEARVIARVDEPIAGWQFWQLRPSARHQVAIAYSGAADERMTILARRLLPMRSIEASDLTPFRTDQRMYSSTTLEP